MARAAAPVQTPIDVTARPKMHSCIVARQAQTQSQHWAAEELAKEVARCEGLLAALEACSDWKWLTLNDLIQLKRTKRTKKLPCGMWQKVAAAGLAEGEDKPLSASWVALAWVHFNASMRQRSQAHVAVDLTLDLPSSQEAPIVCTKLRLVGGQKKQKKTVCQRWGPVTWRSSCFRAMPAPFSETQLCAQHTTCVGCSLKSC